MRERAWSAEQAGRGCGSEVDDRATAEGGCLPPADVPCLCPEGARRAEERGARRAGGDVTTWVPPLAGALLLGALFTDVFLTVFVPRGGPGLVTDRLYRSGWGLWRRVSRLAPRNERSVLALGGPLLLPATVVLWALELVLGFALVYLPFAQQFQLPGEARPSAVTLSLYVSAYSATTLGVGDVYPADSVLRLLSTLEAAMGFALFTVSIAYLLSVYNALRQATSLALEISHFVGRHVGEDPVDLIERMTQSGAEAELTRWVAHTTAKLTTTQQAAAQYPLIHYFQSPRTMRPSRWPSPTCLSFLRFAAPCSTLGRSPGSRVARPRSPHTAPRLASSPPEPKRCEYRRRAVWATPRVLPGTRMCGGGWSPREFRCVSRPWPARFT
jgi:hypothetical protein